MSRTGEIARSTSLAKWANHLEDELAREEATDARSIVVNLSGLSFIDPTGVRLLISARARTRDPLVASRCSAALTPCWASSN